MKKGDAIRIATFGTSFDGLEGVVIATPVSSMAKVWVEVNGYRMEMDRANLVLVSNDGDESFESIERVLQPRQFLACRFFRNGIGYVESIERGGKGDMYSYTGNRDKALPMTEQECREFCQYMYDCGTVGYWSGE